MSKLSLIEVMKTIEDPRNPSGRRHPIELVLSIAVLAILSGCEGYISMGEWIKIRQKELLEFFSPKRSDLPSYSAIRRVFISMNSEEFTNNFLQWTTNLNEEKVEGIEWISIDGKCIKGSVDKETGQRAINLVSAFSHKNKEVLSQYKVDIKTNEINALEPLLKKLNIKNKCFTMDAIQCQKKLVN